MTDEWIYTDHFDFENTSSRVTADQVEAAFNNLYSKSHPRKPLFFALALLSFAALPRSGQADLPVPHPVYDCYLAGVNRIIVDANEAHDSEIHRMLSGRSSIGEPRSKPNSSGPVAITETPGQPIFMIDFLGVNKLIIEQLQKTLDPAIQKRLSIEALAPGADAHKVADPRTVILKFTFGFYTDKLQGKDIPLGAVYTTAERVHRTGPGAVVSESGFSPNFTGVAPPIPFVFGPEEQARTDSISNATRRAVGSFKKWFAEMPRTSSNAEEHCGLFQ